MHSLLLPQPLSSSILVVGGSGNFWQHNFDDKQFATVIPQDREPAVCIVLLFEDGGWVLSFYFWENGTIIFVFFFNFINMSFSKMVTICCVFIQLFSLFSLFYLLCLKTFLIWEYKHNLITYLIL